MDAHADRGRPPAARARRLLLLDHVRVAVQPRSRQIRSATRLRRAVPRPRREELRPRRLLGVPAQLPRRRVVGMSALAPSRCSPTRTRSSTSRLPRRSATTDCSSSARSSTSALIPCSTRSPTHSGYQSTWRWLDTTRPSVTYARTSARQRSPIPPLPRQRARTRQPVLIDLWRTAPADARRVHDRRQLASGRARGRCSRARRTTGARTASSARSSTCPAAPMQPIELATNLAPPKSILHRDGKDVRALGVEDRDRLMLDDNGWITPRRAAATTRPMALPRLRPVVPRRADASRATSTCASRAAGSASGAPATSPRAGPSSLRTLGFGEVLPTGEGLFAFERRRRRCAAIEEVDRQLRAAQPRAAEIADEYFAAETRARSSARGPRLVKHARASRRQRRRPRLLARRQPRHLRDALARDRDEHEPDGAPAGRRGGRRRRASPPSASACTSISASGCSRAASGMPRDVVAADDERARRGRGRAPARRASASSSAATRPISTRTSTSTARDRSRDEPPGTAGQQAVARRRRQRTEMIPSRAFLMRLTPAEQLTRATASVEPSSRTPSRSSGSPSTATRHARGRHGCRCLHQVGHVRPRVRTDLGPASAILACRCVSSWRGQRRLGWVLLERDARGRGTASAVQLSKPYTSKPRSMSPAKMWPLYSFADHVSAPAITFQPSVLPQVVRGSSATPSVLLGRLEKSISQTPAPYQASDRSRPLSA